LVREKKRNGKGSTAERFLLFFVLPLAAQKVWIALEVARAPYEMQEVSLYGPGGKPDWFWDLNPDGTVPVLVCHGGAVVYPDSDLALDMIEAGKALGTGGFDIDINDKKLMKKVKSWRDSVNDMLPVGKSAVLGGKKDKLFEILKEMDAKVEGPYLCGDKATSADCAAFPFLWRLDNEFGLKDYKNLKAWLKTCDDNMAFKKTVQSAWWWWW
jgi:glutathione S-transferase